MPRAADPGLRPGDSSCRSQGPPLAFSQARPGTAVLPDLVGGSRKAGLAVLSWTLNLNRSARMPDCQDSGSWRT